MSCDSPGGERAWSRSQRSLRGQLRGHPECRGQVLHGAEGADAASIQGGPRGNPGPPRGRHAPSSRARSSNETGAAAVRPQSSTPCRFDWVVNAKDWPVSRQRYWESPKRSGSVGEGTAGGTRSRICWALRVTGEQVPPEPTVARNATSRAALPGRDPAP